MRRLLITLLASICSTSSAQENREIKNIGRAPSIVSEYEQTKRKWLRCEMQVETLDSGEVKQVTVCVPVGEMPK